MPGPAFYGAAGGEVAAVGPGAGVARIRGACPAVYRLISANNVAKTSIPSQRFRILRFSFGACWLSS